MGRCVGGWVAALRRRLSRTQSRSGQAYTEFLIVLPGVLLLTLLAWEFAYFWWSRMVVSTATFEAARTVAGGQPVDEGYAIYDRVLEMGMGRMADEHRGGFHITASPSGDLVGTRSVWAEAQVPYQWPSGLGALMGGGIDLHLESSALFRLERFYAGPPEAGSGWE